MKIHIQSPDYDPSSGGIRVLHYFAHLARLNGHDIKMPCSKFCADFIPPNGFSGEYDFCILPEIYHIGNIANSNIVRWVLYYPGRICSSPVKYQPYEYVVSYNQNYLEAANKAKSNNHKTPIFYLPYSDMGGANPNMEKSIEGIYWVGKGKFVNRPELDACMEITRQWPKDRSELIDVLNRTRNFYSFDHATSLNSEAQLCGCTVMLFNGTEFKHHVAPATEVVAMDLERDKISVKNFLAHIRQVFNIP